MRVVFAFLLGGYLAMWACIAADSVGKPTGRGDAYSAECPAIVVAILLIPAALGYAIGRGGRL